MRNLIKLLIDVGKLMTLFLSLLGGLLLGGTAYLVSNPGREWLGPIVLLGLLLGLGNGLCFVLLIYSYELKVGLLRVFIMQALKEATRPLSFSELRAAVLEIEKLDGFKSMLWEDTLADSLLADLIQIRGWIYGGDRDGYQLTNEGKAVQVIKRKLTVSGKVVRFKDPR